VTLLLKVISGNGGCGFIGDSVIGDIIGDRDNIALLGTGIIGDRDNIDALSVL